MAARYEPQLGGRQHLELWVPAEDLHDFDTNIIGLSELVAEYRPPSPDPCRQPATTVDDAIAFSDSTATKTDSEVAHRVLGRAKG